MPWLNGRQLRAGLNDCGGTLLRTALKEDRNVLDGEAPRLRCCNFLLNMRWCVLTSLKEINMRKVVRAAALIGAIFLAGTAVSAQPATSAEAIYCTRAVDIGGIFCAIGCPSDCECHFGLYVSECCCGSGSAS